MNKTIFKKVCGVWFAFNVFGNCFSPAVCLNTSLKNKPYRFKGDATKTFYPAKITLTLRFKGLETLFYWRGGLRFTWNSAHLARRFGKMFEAPHGCCWQYTGIFGHHVDI